MDSNGHSVSLWQVPWLKQSRSPLPPHARSQPGLCNMYKVRRAPTPPAPPAATPQAVFPRLSPSVGGVWGASLSRGHSRSSTAFVSYVSPSQGCSSPGEPAKGSVQGQRKSSEARSRVTPRRSCVDRPIKGPVGQDSGQARWGELTRGHFSGPGQRQH